MIMYRLGIPLMPQEDLAYALGLTVPKEDVPLFKKTRTGQRPDSGWGTHIQDAEFRMEKILPELGIPLAVRYYLIDQIPSVADLKETLTALVGEDADVLVCYDYIALWDTDTSNGHVNVFDYIEGDTVWLVDPAAGVPKYRKTTVKKLYDAMRVHGENNMGGLWLLEKQQPSK